MNATGVTQFSINQKVMTPLGEGKFQAKYAVTDPISGEKLVTGLMVQLLMSDVTRKAIRQSNHIIHGDLNGLWVFQPHELEVVE